MAIEIRPTRFGPAAAEALREVIDRAQATDRLAPVTVVVARSMVGLATRRLLAGADGPAPPGDRRGLVNVQFVTVGRLATDLGGNRLASGAGRPCTAAVLSAAARSVLAALPAAGATVFAPVRDHPATVQALCAAYRDLRDVSPAAREALGGQSDRAGDVVRLVGEVHRRLEGRYDEVDMADAAVAVVGADPTGALSSFGQVVAFLPLTLPPHHLRLLDAVGAHAPLVVVLGFTGVPEADATAEALLERFGRQGAAVTGERPGARRAADTQVVNAPSADAEVLGVLRSVMAHNEAQIRLDRIAIVHGGQAPYPRLVLEALAEAGIPHNGPGIRPLSATLAGRVLLGLLELGGLDWRRDAVIAWLSTGPLLDGGREVPAAAWDRISCLAGVVSGADQWADRLTAFSAQLQAALDGAPELQPGGGEEWRRSAVARDLRLAGSLARFVAAAAARGAARPATWSGWAEWAHSALGDLLGDARHRAGWDRDEEAEACTAIEEALGQLADLDEVDPAPSEVTFRAALTDELAQPAPQVTRFGRGVLVGAIGELIGLDLDVVFVVGMNDGAFPSVVRDDPVLPDGEREAAGSELPRRSKTRPADAHRDFLAALAAARHRVLSFPRGDQHGGRQLRPSRWLLDVANDLAGRPGRLFAGDLDTLVGEPWFTKLRSYQAVVASTDPPASVSDRDLRSLLGWREARRPLLEHPLVDLVPELRAGFTGKAARRSDRFTRFDGHVARTDLLVPSPATGRLQSPTGMEGYAACPRRYLFQSVLRIEVREEPEAVLRISARDRGRLVHRVLERYVRSRLDGGAAAMGDLAAEAFAEFEQEGRTGRPLIWQLDRAGILRDLLAFVDEDLRFRLQARAAPEAVELSFGMPDGPVEVELGGARTVRFRGQIDRVDRTADGAVVVSDYKTGRPTSFEALEEDPVARGLKLQLAVYGLAAQRRYPGAPTEAAYWFVSEAGGFDRLGIEIGPAQVARFEEVLTTLVDGVEAGVFPARPGLPDGRGSPANCRFCDFDAVCPTAAERLDEWERVRGGPSMDAIPELAAYAELAEPADGEQP